MTGQLYNNIGFCSLAINFTLKHFEELPLPKVLLIMPLISHRGLLKYLSRANVKIKSIESLIINKPDYISNFNSRFYDSLSLSTNAIQLLLHSGNLHLNNNNISSTSIIAYDQTMGFRAKEVYKASNNLATILNQNTNDLYTNLRIEL